MRTRVFKIGKRILLIPFVKKLFPDALEKYRRLFGSADYNNASGVLRDTMVRVVNEDLESYLPDIRYPALLIWGDQDDATPMRDAHIMEKMIPDAGLVVIKGAGHFSFLKDVMYSYYDQIESAVARKDYVSINHRTAAFLASYFDTLFAVNRVMNPGEKRLVEFAKKNCKRLPENFERDVNNLASGSIETKLDTASSLVENLRKIIDRDEA